MIEFISGLIIGCAIGIIAIAHMILPIIEENAKLKIDLRNKQHDTNNN